jgi:hypothetical protein
LGIDLIGAAHERKADMKHVVYRSTEPLKQPASYPSIISSNDIDLALGADLITITNFRRVKDKVKKKLRKGQGLEFLLHPARTMTGAEVARWLGDLHEAYGLCQSLGVQFVLSSGANSLAEMVSGICFDEILKEINIEPERHWKELNRWLDRTIAGQVTVR